MVAIGHAGLHSRSMATVQLYYVLSKLCMHSCGLVYSYIHFKCPMILTVLYCLLRAVAFLSLHVTLPIEQNSVSGGIACALDCDFYIIIRACAVYSYPRYNYTDQQTKHGCSNILALSWSNPTVPYESLPNTHADS